MKIKFAVIIGAVALAACGERPEAPAASGDPAQQAGTEIEVRDAASLDVIAEEFVKLALAVGEHDANFVDAYHGPEEWAAQAAAQSRGLDLLESDARGLMISIERVDPADSEAIRKAMLEKLLRAALARIQMAEGKTFSFDEETQLLYDVVAPEYDLDEFYAALDEIDSLLPGDAPLHQRVDDFRNSLAIPRENLDEVFNAAITECQRRTLAQYSLPDGERFTLEYVTDKSWSGYNWYQGDYESLIQVNVDLPIIIDRAVDLGCHEGYPGHHTWNVMLERDLLKGNGWIEYSVYPLFSPLSITAEGSANYGIELAFPDEEKIEFEREVLFTLAGLDPGKAEMLDELNQLRRKLSHARNHIARAYLDGHVDREEAIRMSMEFNLMSRERAEQSVRFIETYRGYVLNYNIGRDLVQSFVEANAEDANARWAAFETLLTTPLAASDLGAQ